MALCIFNSKKKAAKRHYHVMKRPYTGGKAKKRVVEALGLEDRLLEQHEDSRS